MLALKSNIDIKQDYLLKEGVNLVKNCDFFNLFSRKKKDVVLFGLHNKEM